MFDGVLLSHRTWSSTLLQSSLEVFIYGISGSFWCALTLYCAGTPVEVEFTILL